LLAYACQYHYQFHLVSEGDLSDIG
jgi:hypothetical protein